MSKCRKCGRLLKREPWATKGIGPICEKKESIEKQRQDNGDGDIIVPYDGGDVWAERIGTPTIGRDGQLNISVHPASGIKTNVQRTEYYHSPTGFNFGYGGSGPADLALNILLMFTDKTTAHNLHQDFKWKFVGGCQENRLVIKRSDIVEFIEKAKIHVV